VRSRRLHDLLPTGIGRSGSTLRFTYLLHISVFSLLLS
jgi:hypothetical protein